MGNRKTWLELLGAFLLLGVLIGVVILRSGEEDVQQDQEEIAHTLHLMSMLLPEEGVAVTELTSEEVERIREGRANGMALTGIRMHGVQLGLSDAGELLVSEQALEVTDQWMAYGVQGCGLLSEGNDIRLFAWTQDRVQECAVRLTDMPVVVVSRHAEDAVAGIVSVTSGNLEVVSAADITEQLNGSYDLSFLAQNKKGRFRTQAVSMFGVEDSEWTLGTSTGKNVYALIDGKPMETKLSPVLAELPQEQEEEDDRIWEDDDDEDYD